jgi:hypothetical protein
VPHENLVEHVSPHGGPRHLSSQHGAPICNKEAADKAWGTLLALYKAGLA